MISTGEVGRMMMREMGELYDQYGRDRKVEYSQSPGIFPNTSSPRNHTPVCFNISRTHTHTTHTHV